MIVSTGALDWPFNARCDLVAMKLDDEDQALAAQLATDWLWSLSGRRFGTRAVVDRPAAVYACALNSYPSFLQSVFGAQGWPFDYDPRTGIRVWRQIVELDRDAVSVESVVITDSLGVTTTVDPATYRLEGNYLVRQDGTEWPLTQNMVAADGTANTWHVAYTRGIPVPAGGQVAAGLLVCEFAKMIVGDASCKLPYNTTSTTRSGRTIALDVSKALRTTGIQQVDQWVAEVNPAGMREPPQVWSPDVRRNQPPYVGSYLTS